MVQACMIFFSVYNQLQFNISYFGWPTTYILYIMYHILMHVCIWPKSLNANPYISILIDFRYLRLKLLRNIENSKKICNIFHHSFKNIPCYVTSEVSLEMFYFALLDGGRTLKTLKVAYIGFCIQTLHIHYYVHKYMCKIDYSNAISKRNIDNK